MMHCELHQLSIFIFTIFIEAWRSVTKRSLLELDEESSRNVDPNVVDELCSLLERLNDLSKFDDPTSLLKNSNFSETVCDF